MQKRRNLLSMLFLALCMCMFLAIPVQAQNVKQIQVKLNKTNVGKTIQEALDAALEDQSGKTLYEITLPKGIYKLDALLKVYSYTTIKMEGCTLVRSEEKSMLRIGQEDKKYSGYNGQHDITIEGGTWDGNGKTGKVDISMIRMGHGKNITFKNVTFQNVYMTHHVELAGCSNVTFTGCVFKDFYSKGDKSNSGNNEALQFDVLHNAQHFPKYPGFDDTPCANITVTGCTFTNLQRGLGTHSAVAGSYFKNMVFTDNTFTNINGYAIIATNFQNATISRNKISKCGAGILFRSMVQGYNNFYSPLKGKKVKIVNDAKSVISNNKISVSDFKYKTTAYGISLYGEKLKSKKKDAPKGDYTLKGVKVENNSITMNNKGYGIWLQMADKCSISGNNVTMNIKASVFGKGNADPIRLVSSKKITIQKNTLTQKKKNKATKEACGIVLTTGSQATIKSNKINNSCKDGIFVTNKSKATITSNTIKKTGRHGINVCVKSNVTMKKNKISKFKNKLTNTYAGGKIKKK